MTGGPLSRRYAKAIFELAVENKSEEEIGQEIDRFLAALMASPLEQVLNHRGIALKNRRAILVETGKALRLSQLVVSFLCLLLERGRLRFLPSIAERYRRMLNEMKGRVQARAISAAPVEESVLERLRRVLKTVSGKEVILEHRIDPELIGGLVVEMEGRVYDGSVRTQLERVRERMERGY